MESSICSLPIAQRESRLLSPSSTSRPKTVTVPQSASPIRFSAPIAEQQSCPPSSTKSALTTYPPILPPPHFFNLELEAEKLKDMFKVSNSLKNPLYDETGLVSLPADAKGNLILDPESKTRMVDVEVEFGVLYEYMLWMKDVKEEGLLRDGGQKGKKWLDSLREAVNEDFREVFYEWLEVVDEERGKRGLSDRYAHWGSYKGQTYDAGKKEWRRVEQKGDDESSQQIETLSRSPTLVENDDDKMIAPDDPKGDDYASQSGIEASCQELSLRDIAGDKASLSETLQPFRKEKEVEELTFSPRAVPYTVIDRECLNIAPRIDLVTLWW